MFDRTPAYQGDMAPVIEALVPLVADPDQDVAERDQWVLPMLGDAVLDRSGGYSATARENCGRLSSRC
jgi:hypothetical protein